MCDYKGYWWPLHVLFVAFVTETRRPDVPWQSGALRGGHWRQAVQGLQDSLWVIMAHLLLHIKLWLPSVFAVQFLINDHCRLNEIRLWLVNNHEYVPAPCYYSQDLWLKHQKQVKHRQVIKGGVGRTRDRKCNVDTQEKDELEDRGNKHRKIN